MRISARAFLHWRGLAGRYRSLARFAARGLLYLARLLNYRQRECNQAVLCALHNLVAELARLEHMQGERLRALETSLRGLQAPMEPCRLEVQFRPNGTEAGDPAKQHLLASPEMGLRPEALPLPQLASDGGERSRLLRAEGFVASGVDSSPTLIAGAVSGPEVHEGAAPLHLCSLPPSSHYAVAG